MNKFLAIAALLFATVVGSAAQTRHFPAKETDNIFTGNNQFTQGVQVGPFTFSQLSSVPADGTLVFCSDCQVTNPCVGGGTGAIAQTIGGAWVCSGGGGGGGGNWGAIGGNIASQTDLQNQFATKANSSNPSFTGTVTLDPTANITSVLFIDTGNVIGQDTGFTYDKSTGRLQLPSTTAFTSTWPGLALTPPGANLTTIGVDSDGQFRVCVGAAPCTTPGITSFPDGTTTVPGFPSANHSELGLSAVLSQRHFAITNVQRTANVVTITVSTPSNALNWPVSPVPGTISVFGLLSPFDVLNVTTAALTNVTGSTPTSTFTYTLAGPDIASSAASGNAAIYGMYFVGYEQEFGRLVSNTTNPATSGCSICLAKNDPIVHRDIANTTNYNLIAGSNDQAKVGDVPGVWLRGPVELDEHVNPGSEVNGAAVIGVDPTTHKFYCFELAVSCLPSAAAGGSSGQVQINSSGALAGITISGDATLNTGTGALTVTKTNGTSFATVATSASATDLTTGTLNAARLPGTAVQSNQSNTFTAGTQDLSGSAHTLPALKGTVAGKPATCTVGELYFATDATAGQNLYMCAATNTWTQQLNSGGAICSAGSCLLDSKDAAAGIVGNSTAQIVYSFTIPGGTLGIRDCVVATVNFNTAGSASNVYTWTFGSNSQTWTTGTTGGNGFSQYRVCNTGATNTQRAAFAPGSIGATDVATADTNPAIDTTVNEDIAFKFNAANTVTVTPKMWTVEYLKHQ